MPLREEKKQQTRRDILTAARDLIEHHGYRDAKMRDIAAAARLSYQTLYNYFPTKALILQALLLEDIDQAAEQFKAVLSHFVAGEIKLLDALEALNRIGVDLVASGDRELWHIVMTDLLAEQREATHSWHLINRAGQESLATLTDQAQHRGELSLRADPAVLADTLFVLSDHATMRYVMAPGTAKAAILEDLQAQTLLLVAPYLKQ